ncbi:uncharacterized protein LOC130053566 [Ostrea edulis]|uniref:uncharacterized protein LOC130053566 n=1 Tax=Ostrea edulis TaxID=37623 RepID=UPI0024AEA2AB|nr:uncharacterized protein LOC130053566 [Ostrea edulis]
MHLPMDAVACKVIGLYLTTLGLTHFCSSQCVDTRHLNFQRKENSSIGDGHAFKILSNADIWLCMELCYKYTLCRSVDWDRDKTTCRLNVRSATDNPSLLVTKQRNIHVDREHFPEIVAGDCLHHSCNNVSICIRGNCVPTLQDKTCGPLPAVPHAEGTLPFGPFPVGHTHNYTSCSIGYMPSGDPYTSCQDDGKWSDMTFEYKGYLINGKFLFTWYVHSQ